MKAVPVGVFYFILSWVVGSYPATQKKKLPVCNDGKVSYPQMRESLGSFPLDF